MAEPYRQNHRPQYAAGFRRLAYKPQALKNGIPATAKEAAAAGAQARIRLPHLPRELFEAVHTIDPAENGAEVERLVEAGEHWDKILAHMRRRAVLHALALSARSSDGSKLTAPPPSFLSQASAKQSPLPVKSPLTQATEKMNGSMLSFTRASTSATLKPVVPQLVDEPCPV